MDRRRRRGARDGPPQKERSPGQTTEAAEGSVWDEVHLQVLAQCTTVSLRAVRPQALSASRARVMIEPVDGSDTWEHGIVRGQHGTPQTPAVRPTWQSVLIRT